MLVLTVGGLLPLLVAAVSLKLNASRKRMVTIRVRQQVGRQK